MTNVTPPSPCGCDEVPPGTLTVEQARERILSLITPVSEHHRVELMDALGAVLAEAVISPVDVPPHRNSAMDGYAVRSADMPADGTARLAVVGTSWAGRPWTGTVAEGQCVRIMTGAEVPAGADTVIMQEHAEREGDGIVIASGHQPGQNVRQPGEDIRRGEVVLEPGQRLRPAELALLASLGVPEVAVHRRPKVAFFSTGDELVAPGGELGPGQIYDSNRYAIHGMLTALGLEIVDLGVIPDTREAVEQAFHDAAAQADAIVTSGGVSVGDADYVKETLDRLGEVDFWKIAMKPGKPLAFGKVAGAWFFGLPGNPVSTLVTFYQFAQPALRRLMGQNVGEPLTIRVPCAEPLKKRPGRTDFQRGILERDASGRLTVRSVGQQASHILSGMSRANCFIILPRESSGVDAGTEVDVQPFEGILCP